MMMHLDTTSARHGMENFRNYPAVADLEDAPGAPLVFAAVLFADIKGYTRFCQSVDPHTAFRTLSTFHEQMADIISDHSATVMTARGDEVMAAWCGTPSSVAAKALRCGFAMLGAVAALSRNNAFPPYDLNIGVGIHAGHVVVGQIPGISDLSVYGDTVNIASRLEQLTRTYQTDLIVSEEVVQRAIPLQQTMEMNRFHSPIATTLRDRNGSIKIRIAR